jgi:hypothetical protein
VNATYLLRTGAESWYRLVPYETDASGAAFPIGNLVTLRTVSLLTLLESIAGLPDTTGRPDRLLLVAHAGSSGIGIPLVPGVTDDDHRADQLYLGMLAGRVALSGRPLNPLADDPAEARPPTDDELAHLLRPITAAQVHALRLAMQRVQDLHIPRLDIRACNIGGSPPTLEQVARFFGIATACAPREPDAYGPCDVEVVANSQALSRQASGAVAYPDNRHPLAWLRLRGRTAHAYARDRDSVRRWMTECFSAPIDQQRPFQATDAHVTRALGSGGIPIHGFLASEVNTHAPGAQQYAGGWIFPGMPDYTLVLNSVTVSP